MIRESPAWQAYQTCFADEVGANKLLADYLEQNPDGKVRTGRRKGMVPWADYCHKFRAGQEAQDKDVSKILEYEYLHTRLSWSSWSTREDGPRNVRAENGRASRTTQTLAGACWAPLTTNCGSTYPGP